MKDLEDSLRRMAADRLNDAMAERAIQRLERTALPPQKRPLAWWPSALLDDFAPAWPRLAALAGAAALGITIGLSGLGTRIATDLDLVRVASADEGANAFETDTVLRP